MIKYNLNNINDWNYGNDSIKKVYYHNSICYEKIIGGETPPTPSFNGKWKATYSDGSITSAECDSSYSITENEIKKGFAGTNLVAVEIGDCVESINDSAFYRYEYLTSIEIPNNVTSIGTSAFQGCESLQSVTIGSGVTSIGTNTFTECHNLTSVTIPNSVTSIGTSFQYCTSLISVTIPSGVTSIGNYAFRNSSALTSVTIEAITPPTFGRNVFDNTNNCPIYVPAESVNAYKTKTNFSKYASRIFPIQ